MPAKTEAILILESSCFTTKVKGRGRFLFAASILQRNETGVFPKRDVLGALQDVAWQFGVGFKIS